MGNEIETKPWYLSKTVLGGVIAAGAGVAGLFGINLDALTQAELLAHLDMIVTAGSALVGGVLAIYGRLKATKSISK